MPNAKTGNKSEATSPIRKHQKDQWISTPNQPTSTHIASDSEQYKKKSEARFRTGLIRPVRNQTRIFQNAFVDVKRLRGICVSSHVARPW